MKLSDKKKLIKNAAVIEKMEIQNNKNTNSLPQLYKGSY